MTDREDPRRRDDVSIAVLAQEFHDFIKRYDQDWTHTQAWRKQHDDILKNHGDLLAEIAPNYKRGMLVISAVVLGSIAIAIKAFWNHFHWN